MAIVRTVCGCRCGLSGLWLRIKLVPIPSKRRQCPMSRPPPSARRGSFFLPALWCCFRNPKVRVSSAAVHSAVHGLNLIIFSQVALGFGFTSLPPAGVRPRFRFCTRSLAVPCPFVLLSGAPHTIAGWGRESPAAFIIVCGIWLALEPGHAIVSAASSILRDGAYAPSQDRSETLMVRSAATPRGLAPCGPPDALASRARLNHGPRWRV